MSEKKSPSKNKLSADWLVGGVLTKIGDAFDRFTGRRWIASSSIATSELIQRIKTLLDSEAKDVAGKGLVVPHNIKLKMQWDKFSTDAEDALHALEIELLTATVDYISDRLYYTYAPVLLEVKPDYFIEGVKLYVSFDSFTDDDHDGEMNVTVPAINVSGLIAENALPAAALSQGFIFRYEINGTEQEKTLHFPDSRPLGVGRTGGNTFVIDDPSVSKIHASLATGEDGQLSVADTGSTNGTFINDQRISYGKATCLEGGDRVRFGLIEVMFERVQTPAVTEDEVDQSPSEDKISIDGLEFKSRVATEKAPTTAERPEATLPEIPIPDETLRIGPALTRDHEAKNEGLENENDEPDKILKTED